MSQKKPTLDQKADQSLSQNLNERTNYLHKLQTALEKHDDLSVYKLLNTTKYYQVIKEKRYEGHNNYVSLVKDLRPEISHHLSRNLIKYLKRNYPFFYYHENKLGHYQVYFGDWWGHKIFGELDVINVKFNFKDIEYAKLKRAFDSQNVNAQNIKAVQNQDKKLINLIKTQNQRLNQESEIKSQLKANKSQSRMPWNSARLNASYTEIVTKLRSLTNQDKQANEAKSRINSNQQKMLKLSKENTVIGYEKDCVKKYFGGLNQFNENNKQLYYNYISNLIAGGND